MFVSSLLSSENLRIGNQSGDCEALVGLVCSRRKPVAFLDGRSKRALATLEKRAREAGLATRLSSYVFTCGPRPYTVYFLSVAMTDVIGEAVDLDALNLEYARRFSGDPELVAEISAELERLRPMRFSDFLEFGDVDVMSPDVHEYVRSGLVLGYPVESTCQLMETMMGERMSAAREGI
jgi:hypothetical protein